jgi:hypothetical protein
VLQCTKQNFLYSDTVQENPFTIFLNVICLKFLNQEYVLQVFLNCENFYLFPDSLCSKICYLCDTSVGFMTVLH